MSWHIDSLGYKEIFNIFLSSSLSSLLDTQAQRFFFNFFFFPSRIMILRLSQDTNNICESCSLLLTLRGTWNKSKDTIWLCNYRCFPEKPSVHLPNKPRVLVCEWQEHEVSVVLLFGWVMRHIYSQGGVQQVTSLCCEAVTHEVLSWSRCEQFHQLFQWLSWLLVATEDTCHA